MAVEVSGGPEERQRNAAPPPDAAGRGARPSASHERRTSGGQRRHEVLRGLGAFSLVLVTVLLALAAAIVVSDRELERGQASEAQHDARETATRLRGEVVLRLEMLGALRALPLASAAPEGGASIGLLLAEAAHSAASDSRVGLERVLVLDATGALRRDTTIVSGAALAGDEVLALARTALQARTPRVGLAGRGAARRVVIVRPLLLGFEPGAAAGVAVAVVQPEALLDPGTHSGPQRGVVVRAGRDTVLAIALATDDPDPLLGRAPVDLPGDLAWAVEVQHDRGDALAQRARLGVALLALTFLAMGLLRERKQAIAMSERSAELERLSSELLRANRMKSEFLANVSHELRTPLNAIVGFVELLRDGVYGELSPRQAQPVERIAAGATHLRGLVDQVLDIAKMAAGRLEVHPETIVLRPFVLNVMSELESLVAEKGLSLSISVGASLPRVRTDPQHLRSILVNLVGNAIKYTPSGGIVVRARLVGAPRTAAMPAGERTLMEEATLAGAAPNRAQPWIALQVIDTGIGIAPEDRERIFDEFEQVNAGPRGESMERGTGLGLAITRRLARLLGGDVRVDGEPGRGSTFTVWLPVSAAEMPG